MTALASIIATIILIFAITADLLYLHDGPIDTRCPSWMPGIRGSRMDGDRPRIRIRILSGTHANHFGDLVRTRHGKALVRLRDGACVWVEDGEWVRVSP
jgi:hypothetical protein